jgi:outer membrane protein OmpA-like peptidoglycan-associated protein
MKNMFFVLGAILVFGFTALAQEVPKAELFLGYEYVYFNPAHEASGNQNFHMNGGGGAVNFNINKVLGIKAEFTGAGAGDMKVCDSTGLKCLTTSGNFFTYLFGPQLTIRKSSKLQPFVHVLFGGAYSNVYGNIAQKGTVSTGPTTADFGKHAFALAAGGGLDLKVSKSVAIRLGQFDYFMTRFSGRWIDTSGTGSAGGLEISNQSNFRYLGGVNFLIGRKNLSPPSVTCSSSKSTILQGETTTIQAKAIDPDGIGVTYSWNASGGKVVGSGENATFDSADLSPGKYTVTVTVSDGKFSANCTETVTVLKKNVAPVVSIEPPSASITQGDTLPMRCIASDGNNDPLTYSWTVNGQPLAANVSSITFGTEGRKPGQYTIACAASDGEATTTATSAVTVKEYIKPNQPPKVDCLTTTVDVASGQTVELRASGSDPDNDTLTYTWTATSGSVSGSGSTATYNASGVTAGNYTVTVTADDGRGGKASCSLTVRVSERVLLTREGKRPCGYFATGGKLLDNCAKAALDNLAVRMKNDARLQAKVIGYTDGSKYETSLKTLGELRAKAVSAYLEKKGVDATRLAVVNEGTNNAVGDNKTAAGRKLNRRVEIELTAR